MNTGYAVAEDKGNGGELFEVRSLTITQAMSRTLEFVVHYGKENVCLFIEDARQRTWFTGGREKAQGVGSVKRDAQIWEDWCKEQELNYLMIHPAANATKTKADVFKKRTGGLNVRMSMRVMQLCWFLKDLRSFEGNRD